MKYFILFTSMGLFVYLLFYCRGYIFKSSFKGIIFSLLLWPILLILLFSGQISKREKNRIDPDAPWINPSWLNNKIDLETLDMWFSESRDEITKKEWRSLRDSMRENDELWGYSTPPEHWENLGGRAGYAVVRNGKPIKGIVTIMN